MEAKIKDELSLEVELIEGDKGIFDVKADGDMIYSKHISGGFPEEADVVDALKRRAP